MVLGGARCARVVVVVGPSGHLGHRPSASHQGEIWAAAGCEERGTGGGANEHTRDMAPLKSASFHNMRNNVIRR